jgi:hypothetical protein
MTQHLISNEDLGTLQQYRIYDANLLITKYDSLCGRQGI